MGSGHLLSFYGGGFATVPGLPSSDLFGTLEVGAIHGRLLTAWSAAGSQDRWWSTGSSMRGQAGHLLNNADYRPALFTMVGVLVVGFLANLMVTDVDRKHFDEHCDQRRDDQRR